MKSLLLIVYCFGFLCVVKGNVASSAKDFSVSGGQGFKNWYYLTCNGNYENYDFEKIQLLQNRKNVEWWKDKNDPSKFPKIGKNMVVPGYKNPAIRRYVVSRDQTVIIKVKLQKVKEGGDGIVFCIFRDGKKIIEPMKIGDEAKEISIRVELKTDDNLDFLIDAGDSVKNDHSICEIEIN
jgi:hypothetical protein